MKQRRTCSRPRKQVTQDVCSVSRSVCRASSERDFSCFSLCCVVSGDEENVEKFQKRLVKVTKEHSDECKQLLKLMGIPYVDVSCVLVHFTFHNLTWHRALVFKPRDVSRRDRCVTSLAGLPQAPCEAEAQCSELVKGGKVFATGTEDMDALTFGSSILLRHLTFSEARFVCAADVGTFCVDRKKRSNFFCVGRREAVRLLQS